MIIVDISWSIDAAMTAYKDKKMVNVEQIKSFEMHSVRESSLRLGAHTGTHIDAPAHFLVDGATIEHTPLSATVGPCVVLDLMHVDEAITKEDLVACSIKPGSRVLFKTKNSLRLAHDLFDYGFIYLAECGARYLASQKIAAVGIDYLGIERNQSGHETHLALLSSGVVIIEGLRLANVQAGEYFLCCLPLAVVGAEAAPARAVLITL